MSSIQISTFVKAPVDQVFHSFTNFEKADEVVDAIKRIEMLTNGPVGLGTRFKETRIMFGREATEEMEVSRFERNKIVTVSAESCGSSFESTFRFTPQDGGTLVEMELGSKANTWFAKILSPLCFFMTSSMKKMIATDMEQIKAACENGTAGGAAASAI